MKLVSPDHPVLLGKSEPVEFPSKTIGRTASEMLRFMVLNKGCGLAAPQVGIPLRIFTYKNGVMGIVVNPKIIEYSSEEIDFVEGCLTYPGREFRTKRHKSLLVSYQDLAGNLVEKRLTDLSAIIFEHECDHLDGRLVSQHGTEVPK